ncbi:MAG: hypothetical protein ACOYL6_06400 [Bacteriovoracaceae bacterium]
MNGENIVAQTNLDSKLNINKLAISKIHDFKLDESLAWMKELLQELNEDVKMGFVSPSSQASISCEGQYYKKHRAEYGEYAVVQGTLKAKFYTNDVSNGKVMLDDLEVDFCACFLGAHFKNDPNYKDEIEFYVDNQTMDLFFLDNVYIDLKEAFHEYLFLNKDPYPRIDNKIENQAE